MAGMTGMNMTILALNAHDARKKKKERVAQDVMKWHDNLD